MHRPHFRASSFFVVTGLLTVNGLFASIVASAGFGFGGAELGVGSIATIASFGILRLLASEPRSPERLEPAGETV